MKFVTLTTVRTNFLLVFILVFSVKTSFTNGQIDANVNTLRYDGEVNIGKSISVSILTRIWKNGVLRIISPRIEITT